MQCLICILLLYYLSKTSLPESALNNIGHLSYKAGILHPIYDYGSQGLDEQWRGVE